MMTARTRRTMAVVLTLSLIAGLGIAYGYDSCSHEHNCNACSLCGTKGDAYQVGDDCHYLYRDDFKCYTGGGGWYLCSCYDDYWVDDCPWWCCTDYWVSDC